MSKVIYWLFSKTSLGKLVDGNKRLIGFSVWLLGYAAVGLAGATGYFPETAWLATFHDTLVQFSDSYSELLQKLGLSVMAVGVASDAAWQKHDPEGDENRRF